MKIVEEETTIPNKPEYGIASLWTETNSEHVNQIRSLRAELKKRTNSTYQNGKFSGTTSPYLWTEQYGEGDFLDFPSFLTWLHTNSGNSVLKIVRLCIFALYISATVIISQTTVKRQILLLLVPLL